MYARVTKGPEYKKRTPDNRTQKKEPAHRPAGFVQFLKPDQPNVFQKRQQLEFEVGEKGKENHTGLPDFIKEGIENQSGISLDDVKVHYNSDKPAQLQALAYTKGTDIHVAPGQERHLTHEAWHVVQQKQGRVRPTSRIQGVNINEDPALEREADTVQLKGGKNKGEKTGGSRTEDAPTFQDLGNDCDPNILNQGTRNFQPVPSGNLKAPTDLDLAFRGYENKWKFLQLYTKEFEFREHQKGMIQITGSAPLAAPYYNLYDFIAEFYYQLYKPGKDIPVSDLGMMQNLARRLINQLAQIQFGNSIGNASEELREKAVKAVETLPPILNAVLFQLDRMSNKVNAVNQTWHHIYPRNLLQMYILPLGKFLCGYKRLKDEGRRITQLGCLNILKHYGLNPETGIGNISSVYYWNINNGFFGPEPRYRTDDPTSGIERKCPKTMPSDHYNAVINWGQSFKTVSDYLNGKMGTRTRLDEGIPEVSSLINEIPILNYPDSPHSNIEDWENDGNNYHLR